MPTPYVKFQRGTLAAYENLKQKNRLDKDTLYFVYESDDSLSGQLYLKDKLIAGGSGGDISTILQNLEEVLEEASANKFLVTGNDGSVTLMSMSEVATLIEASINGIEFDSNQFSSVDGNISLLGFDNAAEGAQLIKTDGKISWSVPSQDLNSLDSRITSLESAVGNLDSTIESAIADANHLKYQVVDSLSAVTSENIVYLISAENGENDNYDEYMFINDKAEKLGSWSVDLSNYVTTSDLNSVVSDFVTTSDLDNYVLTSTFNSIVGNLSDFNAYDSSVHQTIIDELNELDARLIWQPIGVEE